MTESHAQKRARERYGLELSLPEIGNIVDAILMRDGAVYVGVRKKTTEVWKVRFRDRWVYVAYRPANQAIVTFLTREQAESVGKWAARRPVQA